MQSVDTVTVLVLGKGGVGKSSTVNSLIGERVAVISAFQVHLASAVDIWRSQAIASRKNLLVRFFGCCPVSILLLLTQEEATAFEDEQSRV